MKRLCSWLLYDVMGWTKNVTEPHPDKYIICIAPHTSNWDFIIAQIFAHAEGMECNFLMKKEWFFWPLGPIFRKMGGIPVYRKKNMSMTDTLCETALKEKSFKLSITPEGTRSKNPNWKRGFYYIALQANIPILLYGLDFQRKYIQCTRTYRPTGENPEEEIEEIKQYFKDFKGKHPEKFAI